MKKYSDNLPVLDQISKFFKSTSILTDIFRGGAYKTRTSPHSFSGLGEKGIEILNKIAKKNTHSSNSTSLTLDINSQLNSIINLLKTIRLFVFALKHFS